MREALVLYVNHSIGACRLTEDSNEARALHLGYEAAGSRSKRTIQRSVTDFILARLPQNPEQKKWWIKTIKELCNTPAARQVVADYPSAQQKLEPVLSQPGMDVMRDERLVNPGADVNVVLAQSEPWYAPLPLGPHNCAQICERSH